MAALGVFAALVALAFIRLLMGPPWIASPPLCVEMDKPLVALDNRECVRVVGTAQRKINVHYGIDYWLIRTNGGQALAKWNEVCADNQGLLLVGESIDGFYRKTGERVLPDREGQPVARIPEVACERYR